MMNMPVMGDGKRPQPELQAIAMQKVITYEISYYQTRAANVARRLILEASAKYILSSAVATT